MEPPCKPPDPPEAKLVRDPEPAELCRRCGKPITVEELDMYRREGLCFWCAYVEPQG